MSTRTSFPMSTAGKLFFVSGLSGGREVFLGKAVDETFEDHLALEGKVLSMTPDGRMVVRPFHTTVNFSLADSSYSVQHLSSPEAHEEAQNLLRLSATHVSRTAYPYVHRWVETAVRPMVTLEPGGALPGEERMIRPVQTLGDPFFGLYEGFQTTAEEFRHVLFQSREIESTRELDRVTELEGDLLIEIGKITNQAAIKFNQLLQRERELSRYFDAFQIAAPRIGNARHSMSGWPFLFERLQIAKTWVRRSGKASLVREVNAILKDGLFGLNEVILDHANSLDTLITETFGQYGVSYELTGEPGSLGGSLAPSTTPAPLATTMLPV